MCKTACISQKNTRSSDQMFRSSTNSRERFGEGDNSLSIFNRFWRRVRQNRAFSLSVATENASPSRSPPGNPAGFQAIGLPIKKGTFLMAWGHSSRSVLAICYSSFGHPGTGVPTGSIEAEYAVYAFAAPKGVPLSKH